MGLVKTKKTLAGLTFICAATLLFADQVIDTTFDDNEHDLEQYWYYYDDNAMVGPDDRPQLYPEKRPSVIDVAYTEHERQSRPGDDWLIKEYEFRTDVSDGKPCAMMPFTLGESWDVAYRNYSYTAMPYCGLGAQLAPEGESLDLTGVESIRFSIKSRVQDLEVKFKVQILAMDEHSNKALDEEWKGGEFGYHEYTCSTTAEQWTSVSVYIGGPPEENEIQQPQWVFDTGDEAGIMDFDITQCTKLVWEVVGEERLVDTLDIADVRLIGGGYPGDLEIPYAPPECCCFGDFEQFPYNESPLGTYWYAYSDVPYGGASSVDEEYAIGNDVAGLLNLQFIEGNGAYGTRAPALQYQLGPTFQMDGYNTRGFVGIGCDLYDSLSVEYWDAASLGVDGIYFEYKKEGDEGLIFEILDYHDVGDADNPERKDSRGSGLYHYRYLPSTDGEWRRAWIPFDGLTVNFDWEGFVDIPLDLTRLAKIRWKAEGDQGEQGLFAVDNVVFPMEYNPSDRLRRGGGCYYPGASAGMNNRPAIQSRTIRADYRRCGIIVNLCEMRNLAAGKISLVNTRGELIRSVSLSAGVESVTVPAGSLSAGVYFIRLHATTHDEKRIERQTRVNVVK